MDPLFLQLSLYCWSCPSLSSCTTKPSVSSHPIQGLESCLKGPDNYNSQVLIEATVIALTKLQPLLSKVQYSNGKRFYAGSLLNMIKVHTTVNRTVLLFSEIKYSNHKTMLGCGRVPPIWTSVLGIGCVCVFGITWMLVCVCVRALVCTWVLVQRW